MVISKFIKTREDAEKLPDSWYGAIERARAKAGGFVKKIVAIDQASSVIIGKLVDVEIDKLWKENYPYCKLTMTNPLRYRTDGRFECKLTDIEIFFINKPEAIMSIQELAQRFPAVHEEIIGKLKTGELV